MTDYCCILLPFPGSVNSLWRAFKNRVIKSAKGREYDKDAASALAQQQPLPRFTCPVAVRATFGPPDRRRRDIDNHWKAAGDALVAAGVLEDDSLIHRLTLEWSPHVINGCRVEIEPLATAVETAARQVA